MEGSVMDKTMLMLLAELAEAQRLQLKLANLDREIIDRERDLDAAKRSMERLESDPPTSLKYRRASDDYERFRGEVKTLRGRRSDLSERIEGLLENLPKPGQPN
jgi:chromosome segregation ATPase